MVCKLLAGWVEPLIVIGKFHAYVISATENKQEITN